MEITKEERIIISLTIIEAELLYDELCQKIKGNDQLLPYFLNSLEMSLETI